LSNVPEQRAVEGCNGTINDGYTEISCYLSGSVHWNGKGWKTTIIYFQDNPGQHYKNNWHFLEAYFELECIANYKAISTIGFIAPLELRLV
jgi:hypothetical protein